MIYGTAIKKILKRLKEIDGNTAEDMIRIKVLENLLISVLLQAPIKELIKIKVDITERDVFREEIETLKFTKHYKRYYSKRVFYYYPTKILYYISI